MDLLFRWPQGPEVSGPAWAWQKRLGIGGCVWLPVKETIDVTASGTSVYFWDSIYGSVSIWYQLEQLKNYGLPTLLVLEDRVPNHPPAYNADWIAGYPADLTHWHNATGNAVKYVKPKYCQLMNERTTGVKLDRPAWEAIVESVQPTFQAAGIKTISDTEITDYQSVHLRIDREWSYNQTEDVLYAHLESPKSVLDECWLGSLPQSSWEDEGAEKYSLAVSVSADLGKPLVGVFGVGKKTRKWGQSHYETGACDEKGNLSLFGEYLERFVTGDNTNPPPPPPPPINDLSGNLSLLASLTRRLARVELQFQEEKVSERAWKEEVRFVRDEAERISKIV